jgi:hypothetical protein
MITISYRATWQRRQLSNHLLRCAPQLLPFRCKVRCVHLQASCISFTGGDTGLKISAKAGMVPLQMELGGKDVCIVCGDADLDLAAKSIVKGARTRVLVDPSDCGRVLHVQPAFRLSVLWQFRIFRTVSGPIL